MSPTFNWFLTLIVPLTSNAAPGLVVLNPTFLLTVSKYNVELLEASRPNCITLPVSDISELPIAEELLHLERKLVVPLPVTPPPLPLAHHDADCDGPFLARGITGAENSACSGLWQCQCRHLREPFFWIFRTIVSNQSNARGPPKDHFSGYGAEESI